MTHNHYSTKRALWALAATMISLLLATDTANAKPRTTAQMKQAAKFILARHTGLGNAAPAKTQGWTLYMGTTNGAETAKIHKR